MKLLSRADKSRIRQAVMWDRAEGVCEACGIGLIYDSGSWSIIHASGSHQEHRGAGGDWLQWATYAAYVLPAIWWECICREGMVRLFHLRGDIMSRPCKPLEDRLWPRIDKTEACWNWTGPLDAHGYGAIGEGGRGGRVLKVHAVVYRMIIGEIPEGHVLHHLCRNKQCCHPRHMVAITPSDHQKNHPEIVWRKGRPRPPVTHCKHGHDMSNAYVWEARV